MRLELYNEQLKELKKKHNAEIRQLTIEYVNTTLELRKGATVITREYYVFVIDEITVSTDYRGAPCAKCGGFLLTKKMQRRKDNARLYRIASELTLI